MKKEKLKPCPSCGSKAIRDGKTTEGVKWTVCCSECSFCALITDWQGDRLNKSIKGKMETDELADILHTCGVNAYSCTSSQSAYAWNIYRENIAELILNMCEVTKKAHLTSAMHLDGESDAVYCAGCGFTHKPGKCPDGLNGRR